VNRTLRISLVAAGVTAGALVGSASALGAATASGASFPSLALTDWCGTSKICSYTSKGSSGGIRDFTAGVVDFAASDAPLTPEQVAALASQRGGVKPLYFPMLLGAISVPVNVEGVNKRVRLLGKTVGDIYAGSITNWNDPRIRADNKGVRFPDAPITVCVRSDGSGTSFGFSNYLQKVSPDFRSKVGSGSQTPAWKAPVIVRGPQNVGVAKCVNDNGNSIGYVDLGDAVRAGLSANIAAVGKRETFKVRRNGKTRTVRRIAYVVPSIRSISQSGNVKTLKADLTHDFSNSSAPGAYPITITSWLLAYSNYTRAGKSSSYADTRRFISYMYTPAAQQRVIPLGFAPLPKAVLDAGNRQLAKMGR
jgi:phosphate transport system substrate-binding protein